MKLVVFGATSRTSIPLIQQALDAGHEVVGFLRTPSKMPIQHERLTLIQGDVIKVDDVNRAITPDVDAVLNTIGAMKDSPPDMLPHGTDNIIMAMEKNDVKRLVFMTGAAVAVPQDKPKLFHRFINLMFKTFLSDIVRQGEEALARLHASDRDWVVVRAPRLTDGDYTGNIRVGWVGVNTGTQLNRADAAAFMLQQITSNEYLKQAPLVTN